MNTYVREVGRSLSLRSPQQHSLERLHDAVALLHPLEKEELSTKLERLRAAYPSVKDFERAFPSVCFALATGVGKTRLMGAFIAYLFLEHGIRNFFVLAPNLTIYKKLITDFTPGSPKYVFKGLECFATNYPRVVTGENYEDRPLNDLVLQASDVVVNVFNISKFNTRSGEIRKMRRLSEFLGESYFEYLSKLDDLVILMDEAHRYRGDASMKAIEELKPALGLELTATPQTESPKGAVRFENVLVDYPLHMAMKDGLVKEPAVATRANFEKGMTAPRLEELKLLDGVRLHQHTRAELEIYARQNDQPIVKPFMLVIARDTAHAEEIVATIQRDDFFDGQYKRRVLSIHSGQRGAERDEVVERLLAVENPLEPTEIVVHVNMLKEGWDVTNLYTIVPLRAADSMTLVEQSIGRGLRLPYGRRTGVPAVDRLTIVAHDRFEEIVEAAEAQKFTFQRIQMETVAPPVVPVPSPSKIDRVLGPAPDRPAAGPLSEEERLKGLTRKVIAERGTSGGAPVVGPLSSPETHLALTEALRTELATSRTYRGAQPSHEQLLLTVREVTTAVERYVIEIPVLVLAEPKTETGYESFRVDTSAIPVVAIDDQLEIRNLTRAHEKGVLIGAELEGEEERRLDNYIVTPLSDFDSISYDHDAPLLHDLAGQVVTFLRKHHGQDDEKVRKVLLSHQRTIAKLVFSQMEGHRWQRKVEQNEFVAKGFQSLASQTLSAAHGEEVRDFKAPLDEKREIRSMVFGGFERCLYETQKFDSNDERKFAQLLEVDPTVLKWFKPAGDSFPIQYGPHAKYRPDFVVETIKVKLVCEIKREDQTEVEEVLAKQAAAVRWCEHATRHEQSLKQPKGWRYVLVPNDAVKSSATLDGLLAKFGRSS